MNFSHAVYIAKYIKHIYKYLRTNLIILKTNLEITFIYIKNKAKTSVFNNYSNF